MSIINNKFKKKQIREETRQFIFAVLFVSAGIFLGNISQSYGDVQKTAQEALAAIQKAETLSEKNQESHSEGITRSHAAKVSIMPKKVLELVSPPSPYQAEPDKLNLVYFYPEDADTEDMINSYAGQVFEKLTVMDSEWLADLYELADVSPAEMAARLGKSNSSVKASYNPRDNTHQPDDPETWIIHDWKKIHVNFVDGNGKALSEFSNVKDIISMASVYTYYQDWMDAELFSSYSHKLWEDSHSYDLRISNIYYCDGCLSKTEEELVREAEEQEFEEQRLQEEQELPKEQKSEEELKEEQGLQETQDAAAADETSSSALSESIADADVLQESEIQTEEQKLLKEAELKRVFASFSDARKLSEDASDSKIIAEDEEDESDHFHCPGHVDLFIQVRILGLQEKNGLFSKDSMGRIENQHAEETAGWMGWTQENIALVHAISSQDWFADYGLSVSSICLSNSLTHQEIEEYMNQLPSDLSQTRREIIHFALSSVGKVPYYWGGKASAPGYEGNNFGALTSADYKGRILRGLDCSGWINWVYWSATGQRLSGESTSSLILCGEKISRSQLKPGDIVVRTGTGAHVVMFLSWSADGKMNVIHESSAPVNNVTIKTMEAPWPHYRKLVE